MRNDAAAALGIAVATGAHFIRVNVHGGAMVTDQGLDQRTHILGGIIPIRSAGMARYMRNYVPGIEVPNEVVSRMEDADDAAEEGLTIALETIEQLKETPGIHGVHIMAVGWEAILPELTEKAGLLPRPVL